MLRSGWLNRRPRTAHRNGPSSLFTRCLNPAFARLRLGLLLSVCSLASSPLVVAQDAKSRPTAELRRPSWIWAPATLSANTATASAGPKQASRYLFQRTFEITRPPQSARLRLAADFCRVTLRINQEPVLEVEPYLPTQSLDVTPYLQRGANVLEVVAEPVPGPPAIALSLDWTLANGETDGLVTSKPWTVALDAKSFVPVQDLGLVPDEQWGIGRRDISLAADENYEQWRQTLGPDAAQRRPNLWAAPGFDITLLRTAAADEGSWISMAFDERGRLTISREDRGLLRMTMTGDRTAVDRVEHVAVELDECRGLLYREGWLYANANNSKALYRLRIDDQGVPHDLRSLRSYPGGVGHGRNDLAISAAGLLAIHGDSVETPASSIIDLTSPLRETRRTKPGREGYVVRTNWEGAAWEIVCSGLRNPYGIAENSVGDRFTFDADNEFDMGTPWYRPTRIVHLVPGGDTGYREAGGVWPPRFHDQPDATPPVVDIGRSSPTSVMFGDELAFPDEYRRCLYALDWTYGRVLAIHLTGRGAGWRGAAELFLQGRPLNVTDIAAGPDGAMYLITGGRKTQSALYRVAWSKAAKPADTSSSETRPTNHSPHEQAADQFSREARARRQRLEQLSQQLDAATVEAAFEQLSDADPLIRHAARIALERMPIADWRDRVLAAPVVPESLYGWLALARASRSEDVAPLIERVSKLSLHSSPTGQQLVWLRIIQLCLSTAPDTVHAQRDPVIARLAGILTPPSDNRGDEKPTVARRAIDVEGGSEEVRRRAALLLGEFDAASLPALVIPTLLASSVQEDRIAGLLALADQREGWTVDLRKQQLAVLRDSAFFVGGQGMPEFIDRLRTSTLSTLTDAEKSQFTELLKPPAITDEPLPAPRSLVKRWTLADLEPLFADTAGRRGDVKQGESIFRDALCSRCHRVGILGPAVGPDLTHVARRFSARDILESIVSPSLSVAENYRNSQVITEEGKSYVGRVVTAGDYRAQTLRINTDPLRPSQYQEFDKRQIAEFRLADTSPMPTGLLDGFTLEEIRDLVAYLTSFNR